jgi:hypothetical protein
MDIYTIDQAEKAMQAAFNAQKNIKEFKEFLVRAKQEKTLSDEMFTYLNRRIINRAIREQMYQDEMDR